uniref:HTH IS408-type domain-containing protein n=1 Tax=Candidatus Kentrum sp. TC TaxID=2126339 RepID=A0A451A4R1_9GAMM|nr:MAG: hypothetical protein BECKTC1821F_GA0114240_105211 [Candidatus Kentron sp. TC]
MRKIIEVLRLHFEAGLEQRKIAQALRISKGAVGNYLNLARANGLSWPLPQDMDEEKLEQLVSFTAIIATFIGIGQISKNAACASAIGSERSFSSMIAAQR